MAGSMRPSMGEAPFFWGKHPSSGGSTMTFVGGNAMKNVARACVLGGIAGVTMAVGSGVAFADAPVYPPVAPPTTVTQVLGVTVAQPAPAAPVPPAAVAPVVVVAKPTATLPFTGLDTMALVGVGAMLIVGGSALTIASRKRRSDSL